MKLFFVLVAVLIGLWWWKQRARQPKPPATTQPGKTPQVTMLKCGVCGVHVPDNEALAGQRGAYCGAEHRRQAEGF